MATSRGLTRRQRARAFRVVQYVALVVAVLVFALVANWDRISEAFFDTEVIRELFPELLTTALKNTVLYTLCAFAFGFVLGLVVALMRLSPVAAYRALATLYVEFFRGVPALLVLIAFGYGIPVALNTELPGGVLGTITVALGLVAAAYMAETFRAGIQAVPKGQMEAARSLGMSHGRAMVSIITPQAFRIILPPLTNELVLLFKDSSLVLFLGVTLEERELSKYGRDLASQTANSTPILVAGLCYLLVTIPLGFVVRR